MTRNQLIEEIMRQVREIPELTEREISDVLFRLRLSHTAVLREIYSTNAVHRAIQRAYVLREQRPDRSHIERTIGF